MKKLFLALFAITLVLVSTGCGSKKNNDSIVGSWQSVEMPNLVIIFEEHGTGKTMMDDKLYDDFTYNYSNNVITIKYQTIMETELKYNCEIKNDVLTLKEGNKFVAEYKRLSD